MLESLHPESTPNIHHLSLESPETEFNVEKELRLREQYDSQINILRANNLLETLTTGEQGITAINHQEYPLPTYETVKASLEALEAENKLLEKKTKQGFKKLLIVPFGRTIDSLAHSYGESLKRHHAEGKLFRAKKNPSDPDEPPTLDTTTPVWQWEEYTNADIEGKLVYSVHSFTENHQGKTKAELLTTDQETSQAWQILLVEERPDIPRANQGQDLNGRKQLETGATANDYLHTIQTDPTYKGESGLTPEAWLTLALTRLEETNQVLDDWQGKGSISFLTGAYFPTSGDVPSAHWDQDASQVDLVRGEPGSLGDNVGGRFSVRIPTKNIDIRTSTSLFSSTSSSTPPLPEMRKF